MKKGSYNRYSLLKRMNKKSIVILKGKKRYISFDRDLDVLRYLGFNMNYDYCNLSYLDKFGINYIVLDNLDVVVDKVFSNNNYNRYVKLMYLSKILNRVISR